MTVIKILFLIMLLTPIGFLMRNLIQRLGTETSAGMSRTYEDDVRVITRKEKRAALKARNGHNDPARSHRDANSDNEADTNSKTRSDRYSKSGAVSNGKSGANASQKTGAVSSRKSRANVNPKPETDNDKELSYTPRRPEEWHRSDRVPFGESEGYKVDPPRKKPKYYNNDNPKQWQRPSDALRQRNEEEAIRLRNEAKETQEEQTKEADKNTKSRKKNRSDKSPTKRQLRKNRERARKRDLKKRQQERKQEKKQEKRS